MAERPPWRPWRTGPPRFAVALKPIAAERWLLPETEPEALIERRLRLKRPEDVFRETLSSRPAQHELACLIAEHIGAGALAAGADRAPLLSAAWAVSDDLVVMERDAAGWRVSAIVLCQPTFFSIDEAFGRDLAALHDPVPGGAELAGRTARIFDHLAPGAVLERFNWTLQHGAERFTPSAEPLRARVAAFGAKAGEGLHVRVERQTIRRLPQTGAIVFTIRVSLDPLSALPAPERPLIAEAWRTASGEARAYKGWQSLDAGAQAVFSAWGV